MEDSEKKLLKKTEKLIDECLDKLYSENINLFKMNNGKGVCERCLVFRLAYYLQKIFGNRYYVDCDYNSSIVNGKRTSGKKVWLKKRFIDIIVHKRASNNSDFICFEIKKWNNCTKEGIEKDERNLEILTSTFGYKYGFNIILGKTLGETPTIIFKNGRRIK